MPCIGRPTSLLPHFQGDEPWVPGVATDRLWELFDAGETLDVIAAGYEMPDELVQAAVSYEEQLRTLAAWPPGAGAGKKVRVGVNYSFRVLLVFPRIVAEPRRPIS